jgi:hypothetical protein
MVWKEAVVAGYFYLLFQGIAWYNWVRFCAE